MNCKLLKLVLSSALLLLSFYYCLLAIEIPQDTVFSGGPNYSIVDTLTIINTSLTDTIIINSIAIRQLDGTAFCWEIAQTWPCDTISRPWYYFSRQTLNGSSLATPVYGPIKIAPNSSFITKSISIGVCVYCVAVRSQQNADQCRIMAIFNPNKGTPDSVVIVGPRISTGTKFVSRSKIPIRQDANHKIFDCHGRSVNNIEGRNGIYIVTNGKYSSLQFFNQRKK